MNKILIKLSEKYLKNKIPKNKKVLITGSSGFIGDYLIQILTAKEFNNNNKIYGIDIIYPKKKYKNFNFYKKTLYKIKAKDLPKIKFDYIIHLAGIPSPTYYKKDPLGTIFLNANLAEVLMKKALKDKSQFIYFSSSEIYGNPDKKHIPTREDYVGYVSSISDRSCYDESKRMGETLTYIYKNKFGLKCKIIRPFNFYGNGMKINDKRIIPQFFFQSINKKNITVFSKGKQTRSYCHIFDAIIMIVMIIFKGKNFVYNVGNPKKEINAINLGYKISKLFGSKNKIIKIPYPSNYPSDEPQRRCPDISRFINEFKYRPKIDIDQGLKFFKTFALNNFKKN